MKIVKYTKSTNSKGNNGSGGGGSSSSTSIQSPSSASLDRTIWGQYDEGDDIDGSMIVNGNITIKTISDKNYESDDDDDSGEDIEEESGGGSLFVDEDITVGKHLYVNHSHSDHKYDKFCLIDEVEQNTANIKKNADDIATNKSNITSNLSEINALKSRVSTNETNIANNTTAIEINEKNIELNEIAIKNNADEIVALKNRTTANETAIANYLPIGSIIMFSGTMGEIPEGWAICNGENGTPNLIGKFIKAWTVSGQTGGSNSVTLSSSNLPELKLHVDTAKVNENKEWQKRLNKYVPTLDEVGEYVFDKGGSSHYCLYTGYDEGDKGLLGVKYTAIMDDVADYMYVGEKNNTQTAITVEPEYYSLIYICKIA